MPHASEVITCQKKYLFLNNDEQNSYNIINTCTQFT